MARVPLLGELSETPPEYYGPGCSRIAITSRDSRKNMLKFIEEEVRGEEVNFWVVKEQQLDGVPAIWEMATAMGEDTWCLDNPEALIYKERAFFFMEARVNSLIKWRNHVGDNIVKISALLKDLKEEVLAHGVEAPPVSVDYNVWRFGGPQIKMDPYRASDHDWRLRSNKLQQQAKKSTVDRETPYNKYFRPQAVWDREHAARLAFLQFNINYLNLKLKSMEELKISISSSISDVIALFREDTMLGCGAVDYDTEFRDLDLVPHGVDVPDEEPYDDDEWLVFKEGSLHNDPFFKKEED